MCIRDSYTRDWMEYGFLKECKADKESPLQLIICYDGLVVNDWRQKKIADSSAVKIEIEFGDRKQCIVFSMEYAPAVFFFKFESRQYSNGCVPGILRQCCQLHGHISLTLEIWFLRRGLIQGWVVNTARGECMKKWYWIEHEIFISAQEFRGYVLRDERSTYISSEQIRTEIMILKRARNIVVDEIPFHD